jgi:CheY-like chemotaxis protein
MRPARILVVDDSSADVRLLQEAMAELELPAVLHAVTDGEQALAHLRSSSARPDMILLDLNLPRLDGRELLRVIKRDPALLSIPVIILSTSSSPADVRACYALHANAYLVKPLGLDALADLVRAVHTFWLQAARLPLREVA